MSAFSSLSEFWQTMLPFIMLVEIVLEIGHLFGHTADFIDGEIQIPGILAHQMGFGKNLDAEGTCNGKKQNGKYKFQKKQTGCIIVTLIFHMNPIPFP